MFSKGFTSLYSEADKSMYYIKVEIGTNKTIQFVIYNMGSGAGIEGNPHPVHLHGHHFAVLGSDQVNISLSN